MKKLILTVSAIACVGAVALPQTGLQIYPLEKMDIPQEIKNNVLERKRQETKNGYYKQFSESAGFILNVDKHRSELQPSINDLPMAFKPITYAYPNVIGYAPVGSYLPEKGWTGYSVAFKHPTAGNCMYSYFDLKLSRGGVQLNEESVEYLVNHKASARIIQGDKASGYSYEIDWYTATTINQLECATQTFDPLEFDRVVQLAEEIDHA